MKNTTTKTLSFSATKILKREWLQMKMCHLRQPYLTL